MAAFGAAVAVEAALKLVRGVVPSAELIAGLGVLAAGGVAATDSAWPDVAIGLAIAALFAGSAVDVLRAARRALTAPG